MTYFETSRANYFGYLTLSRKVITAGVKFNDLVLWAVRRQNQSPRVDDNSTTAAINSAR
jgi:hypothetical protein